MFDRVTFVVLVVFMSTATGVLLVRGVILPSDSAPGTADSPPSSDEAAAPEHVPSHPAPYASGFATGYDAFMKQTGQYVPRPSFSYSSSPGDPGADASDPDFQRGYVDGYHRATEFERCPRSFY